MYACVTSDGFFFFSLALVFPFCGGFFPPFPFTGAVASSSTSSSSPPDVHWFLSVLMRTGVLKGEEWRVL
jgi:hypothetical protein